MSAALVASAHKTVHISLSRDGARLGSDGAILIERAFAELTPAAWRYATLRVSETYFGFFFWAGTVGAGDVGAGVKKDSGPYTFQRTIARADFMLASLPSMTSVRWKISPLTTAVLFSWTRLAWMVPLT
jgi:hypothetical protein